MSPPIFTVGHSNHPLDRFLALLAQQEVEELVDIRRFPGSRKHPHFNRDNLAASLPKAGVEYRWLEALGGRRRKPILMAAMGMCLSIRFTLRFSEPRSSTVQYKKRLFRETGGGGQKGFNQRCWSLPRHPRQRRITA